MSERNKDRIKKLTGRYRFVIFNDETHEVLFRFRRKGYQAIGAVVGGILGFALIIYCLVAFTPVRRTIPGYPSYQTRHEAVENADKVDSLEYRIRLMAIQFNNLQRILNGQIPLPIDSLIEIGKMEEAENLVFHNERADSLLRARVDSIEKYNLSSARAIDQIEGMLFFTPVKGIVTQKFNSAVGHPYVDVAVKDNSAVCSILDGTVISAYWTDDTGYNIQIQHSNDLLSIYKHNTKLLKKVGDRVSAGTTISLAGSAGHLSTGPHLHFELWHKGMPVDPELYINF